MTYQEAIKIIRVNGWGYTDGELKEATNKAVVAMDFRTDKPVRQKDNKGTSLFGEALCPECGTVVYRTEDYCLKCGQALDWSEVEE